MDEPRDYETKWNMLKKERQITYITYMWNIKYDTNEPIYETETDTENRLVVAKGEWTGGRDGLGVSD